MTDPIKDGGPAFPPHPGSQHQGMSLRDWFAGQAAVGLTWQAGGPWEQEADNIARGAYVMADAMLAAREGKS